MPRTSRASAGGLCSHVINRGSARVEVFRKAEDYAVFRDLLAEAVDHVRMLVYCLMPNHFHLALWPRGDGDLSRFMQWLLTAQVRRYHRHDQSSGHVWQGRFKALPIQQDEHQSCGTSSAIRCGLIAPAEDWRWSSLRGRGGKEMWLQVVPVPEPKDWVNWVNAPMTDAEVEALRHSVNRGTSFGSTAWVQRTARRLGLEASVNPRWHATDTQ